MSEDRLTQIEAPLASLDNKLANLRGALAHAFKRLGRVVRGRSTLYCSF